MIKWKLSTKWRVSSQKYAFLITVLLQALLGQTRMKLNLIIRGNDVGLGQ